jgi:C4-dicarboxylate-specific signal transduction histidine kinase
MRLRTTSSMLRRSARSSEAETPVLVTPPRTAAALDTTQHQPADLSSLDQIAQAKEALQRAIAELSHDLRQPLTSLNMNIQTAVRLLQQPNPRVAAALDALSDCLDTERDMLELLGYAKRRALALSSRNSLFPLNDLARDILLTIHSVEPRWRSRVDERLASPSPMVAAGAARLRLVLLSTLRRAMMLDECDGETEPSLVLETRVLKEQAELSISGLPLSLPVAYTFQSLFMLTTTLVRHLKGVVHLAIRDAKAVLVVSLPTATPLTDLIQAGDHGD